MQRKDFITDALRYWEPRRIIYNLVLALVTISIAFPILTVEAKPPIIGSAIALFILAALANILYCVAYPVDVFIQSSEFRDAWLKLRWILFATGVALGAAATWLVVSALVLPFVLFEGGDSPYSGL